MHYGKKPPTVIRKRFNTAPVLLLDWKVFEKREEFSIEKSNLADFQQRANSPGRCPDSEFKIFIT